MAEAIASNLMQQFGGVSHPILPKRNSTRAVARHGTQAIMRIGYT